MATQIVGCLAILEIGSGDDMNAALHWDGARRDRLYPGVRNCVSALIINSEVNDYVRTGISPKAGLQQQLLVGGGHCLRASHCGGAPILGR
jgi:hypothetical protein